MALVDYGPGSDSEPDEDGAGGPALPGPRPPPAAQPTAARLRPAASTPPAPAAPPAPLPAPALVLPDAATLLGPPEHVCQSQQQSRKRGEPNGRSAAAQQLSKLPRGQLLPPRGAPGAMQGLLLPPQLRGRSNVATEDLDKLFVRRPQ
eukprot:SM000004S14936  [mRNA]  locus=s4:381426:382544:- [translate_table: standard]